MLVLTLPWPPSVNCYWLHTRQGRTFIGSRAKAFRAEVFDIALRAGACLNLEHDLAFEMDLYSPTRRKFDCDNFLKSTLDALMHARVFKDDSQFVSMNVCKRDIVKGGKAVVRISEA